MVLSPITYKDILATMAKFLRHGKEIEHELILETGLDESVSSDREAVGMMNTLLLWTVTIMQVKAQFIVWSRPQHTWNSGGVQLLSLGPCRLRIKEAPHVNENSTSTIILLLFIMEVI